MCECGRCGDAGSADRDDADEVATVEVPTTAVIGWAHLLRHAFLQGEGRIAVPRYSVRRARDLPPSHDGRQLEPSARGHSHA